MYFSQTLSEKTKELDKLRSEWTSQTSSLSSRHCHELQSEREKAAEVRNTERNVKCGYILFLASILISEIILIERMFTKCNKTVKWKSKVICRYFIKTRFL